LHLGTGMSDVIFETPDNPIPERASAGFFEGDRSRKIRYAIFGAVGRPLKGTVVILTGRNECIEKYYETVRDLSKRGFGVAIFDWRGQGGSQRLRKDPQRGYVERFASYVNDIDRFFSEIVLPDCRAPYYVLAHSTGGLAALAAVPILTNRVRRMVLSTPFLTLDDMPLSVTNSRRLTGFIKAIGLGWVYLTGGPWKESPFEGNNVTSDPARYRRNVAIYQSHPELATGSPTIAWAHAVATASELVHSADFRAKIHIPILFVAAGADKVVSTRAIEHYVRRIRSGSMVTIDGAQHELLQERDYFREQFLAAFDAFIPGSEDEVALSA
jgi:lysophospholipase